MPRLRPKLPPHLRAPVIIADVPAPFEVWGARPGGVDSRSAEAHYRTMTWDDLNRLGRHLDVVAADDCALFLWIFPPVLQELMTMARAWGFEYKTKAFSWVKLYPSMAGFVVGMGYYTRANSEDVFLFTRGDPRRVNADVYQIVPEMRTSATIDTLAELLDQGATDPRDQLALEDLLAVMRGLLFAERSTLADLIPVLRALHTIGGVETILAPMFEHSRKPEEVQSRIERLMPLRPEQGYYLELFARRRRPGWVCLGNELSGRDIRRDLAALRRATTPPIAEPGPSLFDEAAAAPMFDLDAETPIVKKGRKKNEPPPPWTSHESA